MLTHFKNMLDGHFGLIEEVQHQIELENMDCSPINSDAYHAKAKVKEKFKKTGDKSTDGHGHYQARVDGIDLTNCFRPEERRSYPSLRRLSDAKRRENLELVLNIVHEQLYWLAGRRNDIFDIGH